MEPFSPTQRRRILVVDDHPQNVLILEELLGYGFDLTAATSGADALEAVGSANPDLVLLDIMMPGMDGYEVCRRIRANPEFRDTKVILVTALATEAERLRGIEAGADDYVTKPFNSMDLLDLVRAHLNAVTPGSMHRLA